MSELQVTCLIILFILCENTVSINFTAMNSQHSTNKLKITSHGVVDPIGSNLMHSKLGVSPTRSCHDIVFCTLQPRNIEKYINIFHFATCYLRPWHKLAFNWSHYIYSKFWLLPFISSLRWLSIHPHFNVFCFLEWFWDREIALKTLGFGL